MAFTVQHQGYLLKRGPMTTKRRYFALFLAEDDPRGPQATLTYWGSQEEMAADAPARGQLVLGDGDGRVQELAPAGPRKGFTLTAQKKSWTLASETNDAEDSQRWQAALGRVLAACRAAATALPESGNNDDNDHGAAMAWAADARYTVTVSGTDFALDKRYDSIRPLGHGAYGVVVAALDRATGEKVAIKKCPSVFEDPLDAKRIAREIRLLRHFHHPNITKLTDLPLPATPDFADVYMVAEQMDTDLHRVIYSGQKLTEEHVQFFLYQLLCGIHHIHSANVIHRDLKPSNILLNENCDLKICDFGLARDMGSDTHKDLPSNLTEYVVTRWYRAPEIMLSSQEYSKSIDIWACGCIFGEMLGRKPLFPGNDYIHQLKLITKTIGTPTSEDDLWFVKNPKAKVFMLQLPACPPQDLSKRFPEAGPEALDLLRAMLQLDYQKRITVEQALAHPFFTSVRDTAMEFVCPTAVPWGDMETCTLSRANLQRVVLEDIVTYHPEAQVLLEAQRVKAQHERAAGIVSGSTKQQQQQQQQQQPRKGLLPQALGALPARVEFVSGAGGSVDPVASSMVVVEPQG